MQKVLIANRGEIALRVARTCREMGLKTVAAYTQADTNSLHLDFVDDAVCVGQRSYLSVNDIVMAGRLSGCDAVHPGYGFLSENAAFCRAVSEAGMTFIGPTPDQLAALDDKARAREIFAAEGLASIPGVAFEDADQFERACLAPQVGLG